MIARKQGHTIRNLCVRWFVQIRLQPWASHRGMKAPTKPNNYHMVLLVQSLSNPIALEFARNGQHHMQGWITTPCTPKTKTMSHSGHQPVKPIDVPTCRLWYKADTKFRLPTNVNLFINNLNPVANEQTFTWQPARSRLSGDNWLWNIPAVKFHPSTLPILHDAKWFGNSCPTRSPSLALDALSKS